MAGFFTYFYVMNDYGYKPESLFFLVLRRGFIPENDDVYNPAPADRGNTNATVNGDGVTMKPEEEGIVLDWVTSQHNGFDVRLFYTHLK